MLALNNNLLFAQALQVNLVEYTYIAQDFGRKQRNRHPISCVLNDKASNKKWTVINRVITTQ